MLVSVVCWIGFLTLLRLLIIAGYNAMLLALLTLFCRINAKPVLC